MHIVSTKTVTIDATELRDMITDHLREKGILPKGQKCNVRITGIPNASLTVGQMLDAAWTELDRVGKVRVEVRWTPSKEDAEQKVV